LIDCPKCGVRLPLSVVNTSKPQRCPACASVVRIDAFPALLRKEPAAPAAGALRDDHEAGCFYHPRKKVVVNCSVCGRFLCVLCDVELEGRHYCMACLAAGKKGRKIRNLENERVLYDNVALLLATLPLLFFYVTIFTAPAALFIAVRYWKSPSSIIPRTRIRSIAAVLLSALQIAGWSYGLYLWVA